MYINKFINYCMVCLMDVEITLEVFLGVTRENTGQAFRYNLFAALRLRSVSAKRIFALILHATLI